MTLKTSEQIHELTVALAKAQASYKPIEKDKTAKTGTFNYTYADLSDCLEAIRPALNANGLASVLGVEADGNVVSVTTRLIHRSGQWIETTMHTVAESAAPQKVGSAITYGRRYSLLALAGHAPQMEDDDGVASMPVSGPPKVERAVKPKPPPPAPTPPVPPAAPPAPPQNAVARKAEALDYMTKRFGLLKARSVLAHVLDRQLAPTDEIQVTLNELDKIESYIRLVESDGPEVRT